MLIVIGMQTGLEIRMKAFSTKPSYRLVDQAGNEAAVALPAAEGGVDIVLTGADVLVPVKPGETYPVHPPYEGFHWLTPSINSYNAASLHDLAARFGLTVQPRDPLVYDGELVAAYGDTEEAATQHWSRGFRENGFTTLIDADFRRQLSAECLQYKIETLPAVWRVVGAVRRRRD